jgi:NAD(P)-dependent dehydrogenase (short-subunit alcohol dehydrogenase family)
MDPGGKLPGHTASRTGYGGPGPLSPNQEMSMSKGPEPRIAVATGGAGFLGRHVVRRFLQDGIHVHVPTFRELEGARLREFVGEGSPGRLHLHPGVDLSDPGAATRLIHAVRDVEARGPDVLLNLAGGFSAAAIEDTEFETWERMWGINATTSFLCSRAVFPSMKAEGWGRIVNVSAIPALDRGEDGLSAYTAAKAAVLSLTHTLSKEGAGHGITVNAVLPSILDTPANREAMPDADTSTWLPLDEVAGVLAFLASDAARVVNGAAIPLTLH